MNAPDDQDASSPKKITGSMLALLFVIVILASAGTLIRGYKMEGTISTARIFGTITALVVGSVTILLVARFRNSSAK